MDITPLKVKIGTRGNGHANHPDFNRLPIVQASGLDWSQYIDVHGTGWMYDKCCGHKVEKQGSPHGIQWGVIGVPEQFVDEALDDPEIAPLVSELTESEMEHFYDDHVGSQMPVEEVDTVRLEVIAAKKNAGAPLTEEDNKALDPNDDTPGIRNNPRKTWQALKGNRGFKVKNTARKRGNGNK